MSLGIGMSQSKFLDHSSCIITLALIIMGLIKPSGSNVFEMADKTVLLVTSVGGITYSELYCNVSFEQFQNKPKVFVFPCLSKLITVGSPKWFDGNNFELFAAHLDNSKPPEFKIAIN